MMHANVALYITPTTPHHPPPTSTTTATHALQRHLPRSVSVSENCIVNINNGIINNNNIDNFSHKVLQLVYVLSINVVLIFALHGDDYL